MCMVAFRLRWKELGRLEKASVWTQMDPHIAVAASEISSARGAASTVAGSGGDGGGGGGGGVSSSHGSGGGGQGSSNPSPSSSSPTAAVFVTAAPSLLTAANAEAAISSLGL